MAHKKDARRIWVNMDTVMNVVYSRATIFYTLFLEYLFFFHTCLNL